MKKTPFLNLEKAQEIGPYATSHQETITEAWRKLQNSIL